MRLAIVVLVVLLVAIGVFFQYLEDRSTGEHGAMPAAEEPPTQAARPEVKAPEKPGLSLKDIDKSKLVTTASGLQYQDLKVGMGAGPTEHDVVTVRYTGWLADGKRFDSSADHGGSMVFRIGMEQVIKGWDEGIMSMKVGGRRRLVIPPKLGYGERGAGSVIPPNATLIFEVELVDVK